MTEKYDAIVVGARCGGAPTAMLLARKGYRVLLVDKATFPSDTMSTHLVHPPGVAALARWGILERLEKTGCPPIPSYSFDFGPVTISGSPRPADGVAVAYAPRRYVLDEMLVEAAVAAGVEMREGFLVDEILLDEGRVSGIGGRAKGGRPVTERASIVVGADGKHSLLAKAAKPKRYSEAEPLAALYYAYWSGLPVDGFETVLRGDDTRGWAAWPTHDELTAVTVGWPQSEFEANRKDVEGNYMSTFGLDPEFAERMSAATRETPFVGTRDVGGFFRKPFGPGWALVGDAGHHKHPITGFGMSDAFRDAEALASALDGAFGGRLPREDALAGYQRARDEASMPMFELTCELATLDPPNSEMQALIGALPGNQAATDDFVSVTAGTLPVQEFLAPENVARILGEAEARTGAPAS
jgi:flavin-dependent dehydrogenase